MEQKLVPLALDKVYHVFNLGATSLVSAAHDGKIDVMPATWVCPLNTTPPLMTAVIDSTHYTRKLIEKSGYFALALPGKGIARETLNLGSVSKNDDPEKLEKAGAEYFKFDGWDMPFVKGCAAYAIFKVIPEAHNEKKYDLFIGEAVAAWVDPSVCKDGHWNFGEGTDALRPLHYVAGGHFYVTGESIDIE